MTGPEEECTYHCGYISSGRDLLDHQRHEHRRCPDCGRQPVMHDAAVSHKADCPRLQPGYTYPDALRCSDSPEESCSDAGCPVHGDDEYDEPEWDSEDSNAYVAAEEAREAQEQAGPAAGGQP